MIACSVYTPTGSVFCDGSILKSGMIGEGINTTSVLVVKSHGLRVYIMSLSTAVVLTDTMSTIVFNNIILLYAGTSNNYIIGNAGSHPYLCLRSIY